MSSMSATTRSTMTGVSSFLVPSKSSVSAALPRSCSSSGTTSRSTWTTSLASSASSLRYSRLSSSPCSWRSRSRSSRSPSSTNCLSPACLRSRLDELDLDFLGLLLGLGVVEQVLRARRRPGRACRGRRGRPRRGRSRGSARRSLRRARARAACRGRSAAGPTRRPASARCSRRGTGASTGSGASASQWRAEVRSRRPRSCRACRCRAGSPARRAAPRSRRRCGRRRGRSRGTSPSHPGSAALSLSRLVMTCLDGLLVEVERLRDVVEDAEVVDDQAVRLVRRRCGWCGRSPAAGCGRAAACRGTSPAGSARRSRSAASR